MISRRLGTVGRVDFRVRGFAGSRHPRGAPRGSLLLETVHRGVGSAQTEILVWMDRLKRTGEIDHVELIDCRPGGMATCMDVRNYESINWFLVKKGR
jgi:hypothetical protein